MDLLQSIILGFIQGLTEFLPVSSSGHLALMQSMFEDFEQPGLLYDTLLHLATLLAVLIYFRRRIFRLILAFFGIFISRFKMIYFEEKKMLWGIVIATIPTGVIGYLLKDVAEGLFENPTIIGYMLIVTSLMLILADRQIRGDKITPLKAFIVGISQGLAVFPGISRSGTTIFMGLKVGISREDAAEFSFLISIPAIIGATILQSEHLVKVPASELATYGIGMAVAFLTGLFAIGVMLKVVKKAKMGYFAIYCLILGIIAIIWL